MTEQTTRLKRSSELSFLQSRLITRSVCSALRGAFLVALLAGSFYSTQAFTAPKTSQSSAARVPMMHQVGIIPVHTENYSGSSGNAFEETKRRLGDAFANAVRASKRFRVLDDELVASSWDSPKGRQELMTQFDLHVFANLAIAGRGDDAVLSARLLGPQLETFLLESEAVSQRLLGPEPEKEVYAVIENLVFRLFNRIPMDVSITSVQGPFVTLSGGAEQGLAVGQKVEIIRPFISESHPLNGSWVGFKVQKLGDAKVIDVKENTCVGKLLTLTHEGAVRVGDGARVPAIAGRTKFARQVEEMLAAEKQETTVIVPPKKMVADSQEKKYPEESEKPVSPKPETSSPAMASADQPAPASVNGVATQDSSPAVEADKPTKEKEEEQASGSSNPFVNGSSINWDRMADDVAVRGGPKMWSSTGASSAAAKFPLWLVNDIGVYFNKSLLPKIGTSGSAGILFGSTGAGSYSGFNLNAQLFWKESILGVGPLLKQWRAGVAGGIDGLGVSGEKFGGGDWIKLGILGALDGSHKLNSRPFDYTGQLFLYTLSLGRMGYDNTYHSIKSSLGWDLVVQAFESKRARELEWGALVQVGSYDMAMDDGKQLTLHSYSLQALARYRF